MSATPSFPKTGWWRRNAGWLAGALVLGALALWLPYRQALDAYRGRHPSLPVTATAGQWTSFAGARWRLVSSELLAPADPRVLGYLRKDGVVLLVRYEVVREAGTDPRLLDTCRGAITDAQDRRWEAGPPGLPRLSLPRVSNVCGHGLDAGGNDVAVADGQPLLVQHAFVLPRVKDTHGLHARIELSPLAGADGRHLDVAL